MQTTLTASDDACRSLPRSLHRGLFWHFHLLMITHAGRRRYQIEGNLMMSNPQTTPLPSPKICVVSQLESRTICYTDAFISLHAITLRCVCVSCEYLHRPSATSSAGCSLLLRLFTQHAPAWIFAAHRLTFSLCTELLLSLRECSNSIARHVTKGGEDRSWMTGRDGREGMVCACVCTCSS